MKLIKLSQDQVAIIDDNIFELVSQYNWYASKCYKNSFYARRFSGIKNGKRSIIYLHRFIINAKKGQIVDHINGNSLDNRKSNLRLCTTMQNSMNAKKAIDKSSKFKGVSFHKGDQKWRTRIRINFKNFWLGNFDTEIQAARVWNLKAKELFGEYARLNLI